MRLTKSLGLRSKTNSRPASSGSGMEAPTALLRVQIVGCSNLLAKDSNGFSDPFVTVTLGHTKFQTPAISRTLNPIYDTKETTFDFPVGNGGLGALELVVWDKDLVGKDYLGEVALGPEDWFDPQHLRPLAWSAAETREAFSVPLMSTKDHTISQGEIKLKLGFANVEGKDEDFGKIYERLVRRTENEKTSKVTGGVPTRGVGTHTTGSNDDVDQGAASDDSDSEDEDDDSKKRRESATYHDLHASGGRGYDVLGVVQLDIQSAKDLPKLKNMTRTGWDMDPFVVVSVGKKVFRTRVIRHSLSPVWDEKLSFHVRRHEKGFQVKLAVLDWDKMSGNDHVGDVSIDIKEIIEAAAKDAEQWKEYTLPLTPEDGNGKGGWLDKFKPSITFRAKYQSYAGVRQLFWQTYLKQYDTDETVTTSHIELTSMLDSLGSTISDETLDSFFTRHKQDPHNGELTFDQVAQCLEEFLASPETSRKKVKLEDGEPIMKGVDHRGNDVDLAGLSLEPQPTSSAASADAFELLVTIRKCPICQRSLQPPAVNTKQPKTQSHPDAQPPANMQKALRVKSEMDAINHIAVCASHGSWKDVEKIVVGFNNEDLDEGDEGSKYVTASQAQRKWFAKMLAKVGSGEYKLGANSANIIVQNRMTGQLEEEKMQVFVRMGIRLLYKGMDSTMEGGRARRLLKSMSVKQGIKYDAPESAKEIPGFIAFHHLNMDEILDPLDSFKNFNEFFYRKLKASARPVDTPDDPYRLVSSADCRMMTFETVTEATQIWIKGRQFSVSRLLGPAFAGEADKYNGGALAIFRLAPQDYHRFHTPVDGTIGKMVDIDGEYYTVNPQAIRTALDVYGENKRKIVPIDSPQFGRVMMVCIGAMMVGSIKTTVEEGQFIKRGDEFGYFAFGGSTIVALFEPGTVVWDDDLLSNARESVETLVRVGMGIGRGKARS
ncbi:phosphatidylserine decarboxylase [Marasmius crinis-equi]|uniref:Phosphatidylserine decarboxylase proenzyme 2 n=1 Tax=Marasmius crinis-equi TaxID=585013 RepID=A0ABR3FE06_9AGAR